MSTKVRRGIALCYDMITYDTLENLETPLCPFFLVSNHITSIVLHPDKSGTLLVSSCSASS
jgi:hypothetical protein